MAKKKKGQTTIYTTLHRKLKIEQREPHYKQSSVLLVTKSAINILSVVFWLLLYCTLSLLLVTYSSMNILSAFFIGDSNVHGDTSLRKPGVELEYAGRV